MTTFYLIRHAERAGDQKLLTGRSAGVHLSDAGRAHAQRLAHYLASAPIRHVFSSPLERTRETAEPLARAMGVPVEILDAIAEVHSGLWTGRTFPDLDANDEQWRRFNRFRSGTRIPQGETMIGVQARFVAEMLRLRDAFPEQHLALVSHADPIKTALACFLGAPLDLYDRIEISLGSISVVALHDWGAKILRINDVPSSDGR